MQFKKKKKKERLEISASQEKREISFLYE